MVVGVVAIGILVMEWWLYRGVVVMKVLVVGDSSCGDSSCGDSGYVYDGMGGW